MCFFSLLIKAFANFEKLIRFHWQAFIVYTNAENLKGLIEMICQKLIVSNVILVFLDHLKPKIFFVNQQWWTTWSATPFQNLSIRPWLYGFSVTSGVYFLEKYDGLSELLASAQNRSILQTRVDQKGDHMKMSFEMNVTNS